MKEKFGRVCKELMAKEISDRIKAEKDLIVTSFNKISVAEMSALRSELKSVKSIFLVAKNSLFKLALEKAKRKELSDLIGGQSAIALGSGDPAALSKILNDFKSKDGTLVIKGGMIEGAFLRDSRIKELAKIPPREVLLARAVGGIKAPLNGFVLALNGLLRGLVYVLNQVKEKKNG
ncbi:MAG: 50S ribosomal protein L10 [Candidatus Omnitrophica bacterium CG1_02_49_10]|nr:MAG: 50S ribosomal protein L10 [Candidatus Omnitrophica bacterium CG1_02_49_10]